MGQGNSPVKNRRTTTVPRSQPYSGTSSSISDSPISSPITYSSFDSALCSSITPSLFHSRLKLTCFTILPPVVSLLSPPGLHSRTITARTVSSVSFFVSDIAIFVLKRDVKLQLTNFFRATRFLLFFFPSVPCARLSWPSRQLLSAR